MRWERLVLSSIAAIFNCCHMSGSRYIVVRLVRLGFSSVCSVSFTVVLGVFTFGLRMVSASRLFFWGMVGVTPRFLGFLRRCR